MLEIQFLPLRGRMNLDGLLDGLPELSPHDRSLVERAWQRAEQLHEEQTRKSGEPYFTHCVAVARILVEVRMDAEAIAAGLLHDTLEDTGITKSALEREFGRKVAALVDGVSRLSNLPLKDALQRRNDRDQRYLRKMMLAMGDDVRVVIVKLADRLHNMRTLGYMPPEKQLRIAQDTLDFFAPLANLLGIWQFKWELEDLSFRYLHPQEYRRIATSMNERRVDREQYLQQVSANLREELAKYNLDKAIVSGRSKHIYSIYNKMLRKELPFEQIYDVRALRVIVDSTPECYLALGIVHNLWRPIPVEFDDYIASPKDNFYQSLHTAVLDSRGKTLEVQIRTRSMHEHAEYGIAAHWRYKEDARGTDRGVRAARKFSAAADGVRAGGRRPRVFCGHDEARCAQGSRLHVHTQRRYLRSAGRRHAHRLRLSHSHGHWPSMSRRARARALGQSRLCAADRRSGRNPDPLVTVAPVWTG